MNVSVSHLDLFPTRIWSFNLTELAPHFAQWREAVDQMRTVQPAPAGRSNRQGWNSDKTVFEQAAFGTLAASVQLAFTYAMRQVTQGGDTALEFEAWVNLHDRGGYNCAHVHQGALLCGSFYLTVPEGSGSLVFRDPRPGVALSPFRGDGINNARNVNVTPYAGLLVLFPNWLEHEVALHEADQPRVSIAVNAMLPGQGARDSS